MENLFFALKNAEVYSQLDHSAGGGGEMIGNQDILALRNNL